jgi:hypothetical protein
MRPPRQWEFSRALAPLTRTLFGFAAMASYSVWRIILQNV